MRERRTHFPTPGNSTNGDGLLGMACSDNNMTASGVPEVQGFRARDKFEGDLRHEGVPGFSVDGIAAEVQGFGMLETESSGDDIQLGVQVLLACEKRF